MIEVITCNEENNKLRCNNTSLEAKHEHDYIYSFKWNRVTGSIVFVTSIWKRVFCSGRYFQVFPWGNQLYTLWITDPVSKCIVLEKPIITEYHDLLYVTKTGKEIDGRIQIYSSYLIHLLNKNFAIVIDKRDYPYDLMFGNLMVVANPTDVLKHIRGVLRGKIKYVYSKYGEQLIDEIISIIKEGLISPETLARIINYGRIDKLVRLKLDRGSSS